MKQAAGEKASVAESRSPPGSLCEDKLVTVLRTQLWVAGTMQPLSTLSKQKGLWGGGGVQTRSCCSRMRTSDS